MQIWPLNAITIAYVVDNMRDSDRREIFATRWTDSQADLVKDCLMCGHFGWVMGLERPISFVGATPMHPGVWGVHMFATPEFRRIGHSLTRHVRRVMIPSLVSAGAHRAECKSMEGHDVAHRWLGYLGAQHEATLKEYGRNGEDFRLYVWRRCDVHVDTEG